MILVWSIQWYGSHIILVHPKSLFQSEFEAFVFDKTNDFLPSPNAFPLKLVLRKEPARLRGRDGVVYPTMEIQLLNPNGTAPAGARLAFRVTRARSS